LRQAAAGYQLPAQSWPALLVRRCAARHRLRTRWQDEPQPLPGAGGAPAGASGV
nr:hypothetical protein [Tanacetum cinerariifolium]